MVTAIDNTTIPLKNVIFQQKKKLFTNPDNVVEDTIVNRRKFGTGREMFYCSAAVNRRFEWQGSSFTGGGALRNRICLASARSAKWQSENALRPPAEIQREYDVSLGITALPLSAPSIKYTRDKVSNTRHALTMRLTRTRYRFPAPATREYQWCTPRRSFTHDRISDPW